MTTVTEDDDITDPPTDPGIRRFTKSPPRPNEQRVGGCYNRLYKVTDSLDHKLRAQGKCRRRTGRRTQQHELSDLTDDSTDDGIIGNDEDVDEGEGVKDEEDSDQSILTASPALSEEMRSNASDESSMVTPTNDLEDEDVDDEEDEDEEEEEEVADEKDTNGDTVDGSGTDGASDGGKMSEGRNRSTFESTVESSTCNEAIDHRRSMNRRSNSHWSVRPNVSYITSEAIAIKSSVQLSHSSNGNGQSSFHSKNNDRASHNRADGGHSRGHKNLTSSPVTPSGRDESGITTSSTSCLAASGASKVHSVQSTSQSSSSSSCRTSFDRQMQASCSSSSSGVNSQLLPGGANSNSPQFTSQPASSSSLNQHQQQQQQRKLFSQQRRHTQRTLARPL